MELLNMTGMLAGYTLGIRPDGRESLVVCVKGTFLIPLNGADPVYAENEVPLVEADIFTGEPGLTAVRYESDYPPRKPRCDVLLNGSAYAPGGRAATKVTVSLRFGIMEKSFNVVGNRPWEQGLTCLSPGDPEPFMKIPVSYDVAFGGTDTNDKDPKNHRACMDNPVGKGFHHVVKTEYVGGKPMPNTEEIGKPVSIPNGQYRPMSFGPIGRNFQSRIRLAGTYDQNWLDNHFPFLPTDFDEGYYQSAPADQQVSHPVGGEEIVLVNLTPSGQTRFRLPKVDMPIEFNFRNFERVETRGVIDTVVIEPDDNRFMLTWRASIPLKRNIFEVVQVIAGRMPNGWVRARETGKTFYPTLGHLVASRKRAAS
jgi:hypothetical protein